MAEVNGPYLIEDIRYVREATNSEEGVLLITTAGGEQFEAPMSANELRARIANLQQDVG